MCGILAFFDSEGAWDLSATELRRLLVQASALMTHRGPDGHGIIGTRRWAMCHERLAIMDPQGGQQPITYGGPRHGTNRGSAVVANGEIYNFRELQEKHGLGEGHTSSDSEVLLQLWDKFGYDFCNELNGMFGFVIASSDASRVMAARDHIGIKPLYIARAAGGVVAFASELKALTGFPFDTISEFPSGHYWTRESGLVRYYNPDWHVNFVERPLFQYTSGAHIRRALEDACRAQSMSDVPFGVLLSGGVDSAVLSVMMKPIFEELGMEYHTFTVGADNSPDRVAAQAMSDFLGTTHHEYVFTFEEAFKAVDNVIYHLETYETELIRSAIPNYFLAKMTSQHVKMVLTGEGADELFGGYLYFRDSPDSAAFHQELCRIFDHLPKVNNQRSDRMSMASGLEARVPFLQPSVIHAVMHTDPELKVITGARPAEKHLLRSLFDGELPDKVLWRTKAMQCEGVGMNWVSELQKLCNAAVSDEEFAMRAERFPLCTPMSKEEYYYRTIFEKHYKGMDAFVHTWEGGCRAGGAAWKSAVYTREGLANTSQLARGLGLSAEVADVARPCKRAKIGPETFLGA